MATSTVTTSAEIPAFLEPFYTGTGEGADRKAGLIEQAVSQIFPSGAIGPEAYSTRYADLIKQGLTGHGSVAGLTPEQVNLKSAVGTLGLPTAFESAEDYAKDASTGLSALQNFQASAVGAPDLLQYQMSPVGQISSGTYNAPTMQAAQMAEPEMFGAAQMQQYMSPYMQGVVDVQQRKAVDAARQAQLGANLGAARSGTYGGARQAVIQGLRESGLRQEMGDIQARGLQSAYENAQQQFERDRASSTQARLANLNAAQQAAVQNQAAQLQTQGLSAEQAMRAALANQQSELTVGQQNLAAALGVQQLGAGQELEAQRANQAAGIQAAQQRLGAGQALAGLSQTMGGLGTQQLAGELDIIKTQGAFGDLERAIDQQKIDAQRRDIMQKAEYGMTQVGDLSNILRGIPLNSSTQQSTTPPPSFASQLTGMGLTGIGLYNLLGGGKTG